MNRCNCGHDKSAHIYEEGACRPGFVCEAGCEKFSVKKPVVITSLAVRFYSASGWTLEALTKYVIRYSAFEGRGPFVWKDSVFGGGYWLPEVGTQLDYDRMYAEEISSVQGKDEWGETRGLTDLEALHRRSW